LPLLAISIIALLGMIALAVDIGMVAVARTQAQDIADLASLAGARMLNGDASNPSNLNNINTATSTATDNADNNKILGVPVTAAMVTNRVGIYTYNSGLQRFEPSYPGSPGTNAWSALETTINTTTPTYFGRVFGINSINISATATAAHRPRDLALILDMSGSMRFGCQSSWPSSGDYSGSLNPDTIYPKFGPYSTMASVMQRTTAYVDSGGEAHAPNNLTMDTSGGDAIVRDFLTKQPDDSLVNAFHQPPTGTWSPTQTPVCTPAPDDFDLQSSSTATYAGDKWPLKSRATTGTNWAATVEEYLAGSNTPLGNNHAVNANSGGYLWETLGYGVTFAGYSMGPGYYGKTFWIWPPDPRAPVGLPGAPGAIPGDWRRRFFKYGENYGTTALRNQPLDDNSVLFDAATGYLRQPSGSGYRINYAAILAWLKSGPQVLPPNLRAGRILYYESIPDDCPNSGGSLDQVFWRNYIHTVLGVDTSRIGARTLYGRQTAAWGTLRITPKSSLSANPKPYMHYNDNPIQPRAQFWFGPLTMMMFITDDNDSHSNMWPGTVHESQTWQLKAGIRSALEDIRVNHPNDWASLIYFSDISSFSTVRVAMGRDYTRMKNALFFPFSLLDSLGDTTAEIRPYNGSFNYTGAGDIPNANGGTTPEMALMVAYNQFSSRTGFNGRRGASKVCILETDGVPNTTANGGFTNGGAYNSMYTGITTGSYLGNGNSTVISDGVATASRITALDTNNPPGYSSARNPARIHCIAFGDLFETTSPLKDAALDFLAEVQVVGFTSPTGTNGAGFASNESYKVITGTSTQRIDKLRQALERIMQSGVQVVLIR
jgi:hypothetical protein